MTTKKELYNYATVSSDMIKSIIPGRPMPATFIQKVCDGKGSGEAVEVMTRHGHMEERFGHAIAEWIEHVKSMENVVAQRNETIIGDMIAFRKAHRQVWDDLLDASLAYDRAMKEALADRKRKVADTEAKKQNKIRNIMHAIKQNLNGISAEDRTTVVNLLNDLFDEMV